MPDANLKTCRICGSNDVGFLYELDSLAAKEKRRFDLCNACETVLDELGTPPSYDSAADNNAYNGQTYIRFYVEVGAGLHTLSTVVSLLSKTRVEGSPAPRFLDVGAGFGYTVSIAAAQGWDAIGLEPSGMGRAGKQLLGVNLESCYLEDSGFPEESFDFIASSEVIEHVTSPGSFVGTLSRYLKNTGVLALTTPNGIPIRKRDAGDAEWHEALSPGYHMNLMSPQAMTLLLSQAGFTDIRHFFIGGSSRTKHILTLAAKHEGIIPKTIDFERVSGADAKEMCSRYLEQLIERKARAGEFDPVYEGALFRLFEHRLNNGDYPHATESCALLDDLLTRRGLGIIPFAAVEAATIEEYLDKVPAYAGMFSYCRGVLLLNSTKLSQDAARCFETAAHLFRVEQRVGAFPRVLWPERAEMHMGIALLNTGKRKEAIAIFNKLLDRAAEIGNPIVDTALWNKGIAHLQLGEDQIAFSMFMDLFFRQSGGVSPDARRSAQHAFLSICQMMHRFNESATTERRLLESIATRLEAIERKLGEPSRVSSPGRSQK
jgi:SAM-dependent methyltransferase